MALGGKLQLLFLHALPLDGSMWDGLGDLLPGSTLAPTLYGLGESIGEWADAVLKMTRSDRLIVVGCSVGGSCALEIAARAPGRVAALVLIGTKAAHRPDPAFRACALQTIRERGLEAAWQSLWAPLVSDAATGEVIDRVKSIALRQSRDEVARGVNVFHTRPGRKQVLSDFPGPIVVVSGADDIAPGLEKSAAQAALARHGRLHVIPDCGHYVPLERPEHLRLILRELIAAQR